MEYLPLSVEAYNLLCSKNCPKCGEKEAEIYCVST